jgi:aromatic-amino-acid transaminase
MSFFEELHQEPSDPILGLISSFNADSREKKVNLGAGVYKTEDLKPFIFKSVKKTEAILLEKERSKDYLPIDGLPEYVLLTKQLVFGKKAESVPIYGAQTPGATAALRVGGAFLKKLGLSQAFLSNPTWGNHRRIFKHAGLSVFDYPYFSLEKKGFDFPKLMETFSKLEERSIVVFHASCHNPTGFDPSLKEWEEIWKTVAEKRLFPFFDLAYQGLGDGLDTDAAPLRHFLETGLECAVAVSHAKNFGLYAERCGALFMVCRERLKAEQVGSHIKVLIRGLYSNPPCHGARIVATLLQDGLLKKSWEEELREIRERIATMRELFVAHLRMKNGSTPFDFLALQKGMFSYTGLTEKQVARLIADYGIYLPKDGRINIAGLNKENLEYVTEAIRQTYASTPL